MFNAYHRHLVIAGVVAVLLMGAFVAAGRTPGLGGSDTHSTDDTATFELTPPRSTGRTNIWLGDEVVGGCCRSENHKPTLARTAADALGWRRPIEIGAEGLGYMSGGRARAPLFVRLDRQLKAHPAQMVILGGAGSDFVSARRFDEDKFRAAVRATFDKVLTLLPATTLIVLGPYSNRPNVFVRLRAVLAEEAARVHAPFIDIIGAQWMVGHPELMAGDGYHPNDAGQVYLGNKIAEVLRSALPPELVTS